MKTDNATIIYDPIKTAFNVIITGGTFSQRQETLSGDYDIDRTLVPLVLKPSLFVSDPNDGTSSDKTKRLINVRWYNDVAPNEAKRIANGSDFTVSSDGVLTINKNVPGAQTLNVYMSADYYDVNRQETHHFTWSKSSTTGTYTEFSPHLQIDVPNDVTINPFTVSDNPLRTITAKLMNGENELTGNVTYQWFVLSGTSYVPVTTDYVFCHSVAGGSLVVDLTCIGSAKFKIVAYHNNFNSDQFKRSEIFQIKRVYQGWDFTEKITAGKYLRSDTANIIATATITTKQLGVLSDPLKYFAIRHYFFFAGQQDKKIEVGKLDIATLPRDIAGTDRKSSPIVGANVFPLTERRPIVYNNNILTYNGMALTVQLPEGE